MRYFSNMVYCSGVECNIDPISAILARNLIMIEQFFSPTCFLTAVVLLIEQVRFV
ncbi:uncharacterized protein METZ01_LOCUS179634 [marine metagenome]|uniref:Uncharacterized protein n=1 Tax=marine metagenome TaxID=408172 RepID=A0A382CL20_9ZZZZ